MNGVRKTFAAIALAAMAGGVLAACGGGDDGAGVRTLGCDSSGSGSASGGSASGGSASGSGSGSSGSACASASGSGSGSGLSQDDLGDGASTPELQAAVDGYREYVDAQVADTVAKTKVFTDAVRAGNIDAAKAAFAPSRVGWESIEPVAALVEAIDGAVDARVDDFESETDPTWTGWHRLEYLIFDQGTLDGATEFADKLDEDLGTLETEVPNLELTPLAMSRGASELIEEVSQGKITGEEDRYSKTDLTSIQANLDGSKKVIELLEGPLAEADDELLTRIDAAFTTVQTIVDGYRAPDGSFLPYNADSMATPAFKAALGELSEALALVPGALKLK